MTSATYAAVRSGPSTPLRITADTASSALCGAPHKAEFERELIRERTQAGLAAARARGRKGGRPKLLTPEKRRHAVALYQGKKHSIAEICRLMGISKPTLYSYVEETGA